MKRHFYSHIIETSHITLSLGDMELSREERLHLLSLIESQLHHVVVDAILSELSEEDKRAFLSHLASEDHDRIWNFLNTKVEHVEEKIKKAAEDLKKELHKDLKKAK